MKTVLLRTFKDRYAMLVPAMLCAIGGCGGSSDDVVADAGNAGTHYPAPPPAATAPK